MTDNPYVIACLTTSGADYRGEIHAAPVNDVNTPPKRLTDTALHVPFPPLIALMRQLGGSVISRWRLRYVVTKGSAYV